MGYSGGMQEHADAPRDLEVKTVPLDELVPDESNARTHGEKNMAAIMGSLSRWGQVEALVIHRETRRVLGGNGRLDAMKRLGWTHAKVVEVDFDESDSRALALALNRTAELAGWDNERLAEQTEFLADAGFDLGSIGFAEADLTPLWAGDNVGLPEMGDAEGSETNERVHSIRLTLEQREVFNKAAFRVREQTGDHEMTDGRVLELIAADYLAGK
jgi:ParB-like chromosome segregation protein Spo0J